MRGLSFLNPWLLVGLGTIAIPIIIHLINRRRAYLHRFAAIEFLLRSQRRIAAKFHLKQLLLLAARCGAVAVVCLALARPVLSRVGVAPVGGHEPTSLILILDDSYSMQYDLSGRALFERARSSALNLLRSLHRTDNAAVFLGGAPSAGSWAGLTFDAGTLLRDVGAARCGFGATDIPASISAALPFLRESKLARKRVCVLTDAARHGWRRERAEGLAERLKAARIACDVLDVGGGEKAGNIAVTDLSAGKERADALSVTARISNRSDRSVSGLACNLLVDGKPVGTGFVDMSRWGTATKEFSCGTIAPGYHVAEVRVDAAPARDRLAADDKRWLSLMSGRPVRALLVDGAPGPHVYASETFYLERALSPESSARGPIRAVVVTEAQFAEADLSQFDCVFLCNVGTVGAEKIRELTTFVERGGGLFISVGDNVDAGYYNRSLAPLLPGRFRDKNELPGAGIGFKTAGESGALMQELKSVGMDLGRCAVKKAFLLEAGTGAAARILSFTNDTAALVERAVGAGRVLLLTTTVDRDWTDLPIMPGFLPLMQMTARYLAGRMAEEPRLDTTVGQAVEAPAPAECKRVRIKAPDGSAKEFEVAGWRPPRRVKFAETFVPGPYEVAFLGMAEGVQARGEERTGFVVNLDAESESNLQRISQKELAWFGARMVGVRESEQVSMSYLEFGVERGLWGPLLAGLIFLLTVECLLARKP